MKEVAVCIAVLLVVACTQAYVDNVLHDDFRVTRLEEENGKLAHNQWTPSEKEREEAENSYIGHDGNGHDGAINGHQYQEFTDDVAIHTDYIDNPINLTYTSSKRRANTGPALVETLIVVDKEFCDIFQHNQGKIVTYLTNYFRDMNLRYKTLPSVDISFKITGIVQISSPSGQPFIENARASDGRAEFGRILSRFNQWVVNERSKFKKFDLAICITNTRLEWGGGLAYLRSACGGYGAAVFNDGGDYGSATVGAHEIAHTLGAPHDEDICNAKGYIMSGGNDKLKWYFSHCSDQRISAFVNSDQAACLRRIDETGTTPTSYGIYPPPMVENCRRRFGPNAWMEERDNANCINTRCVFPRNGGGYLISNIGTAENAPCLPGGRCFRGKCRKEGSQIQNVGSGLCMSTTDPTTRDRFSFSVPAKLLKCQQDPSPLDTFVISDTNLGKTLATPWWTVDASETGDKCIYTGNAEGNGIWTDRCSGNNPWHGWDFVDVGNGEFMLSHRVTRRCARQNGVGITTHQNCDRNNRAMRWRRR